MVLEVINQVLLAMLAQEVEFNLPWGWRPLEVVERLGWLDLGPAGTCIKHTLNHIAVVAERQNILIQLSRFLLIQGEQIVLCFNLSLLLELMSKLLLFCTWSPDWRWLIMRVLVDTAHPLEAAQLLVSICWIIVPFFAIFLLLLHSFCLVILGRRFNVATTTLRWLLALKSLFIALSCARILLPQLLWGPVTTDICNRLRLLLFS